MKPGEFYNPLGTGPRYMVIVGLLAGEIGEAVGNPPEGYVDLFFGAATIRYNLKNVGKES